MAGLRLLVLADEDIENAVSEQLTKRGIEAKCVSDVLPIGIDDNTLLEYAYQHSYTIITIYHDIAQQITKRISEGKNYSGVFVADKYLEGGIGYIIDFIADYDKLIKGGAASLQDDVYNQTIYIK